MRSSEPNRIPIEPASKPPRRFQRGWIVLSVVLALALVGAVAAFFMLTSPAPDDGLAPDPNVKVGSLTGNTDDLDKIVEEGLLTFSINVTPVFDTGDAQGNLMIENTNINNNRFTCAIFRNDTGERIYQSGTLDPGQYIEFAPLEVDLAAGEYPCTAYFNTYSLQDNTPIGQAAAEITIYVLG